MSWNYKHMNWRNYLSTNKLIDKTKNGENVPSLGVVGVVLVQCNLVDNQHQQKWGVIHFHS